MLNSLVNSNIKIFNWIFLLLIISFNLQAQQVTKVDCCSNIETKATIIINNTITNTSSATTNASSLNNTCNFKLTDSVNTSAGVYNTSGQLIRTLWSGVLYGEGCYNLQWDGLNDNGTAVANGSYTIKIQKNKIKYIAEGGIGNTSNVFAGPTVFHGPLLSCMAVSGTKAFYGTGHSENFDAQHYFNTDDIGVQTIPVYNGTTMNGTYVCTDDTLLYWAGLGDQGYINIRSRKSYVYAENVSDRSLYTFSSGVTATAPNTRTYPSVVSYGEATGKDANSYDYSQDISGEAVQKNGSFLFVARILLNQIQVLNKKTGALIQTITNITAPGTMKCDASGNIWIQSTVNGALVVVKYSIDSNGNLTNRGVSIPVFSQRIGMDISPVTSELAIADPGVSQVTFYNESTGILTYTQGDKYGYLPNPSANTPNVFNPAVSTNKFMLTYDYFAGVATIAFQPDGKYWVGDPGCFRNLRFNADHTYNAVLSWMPQHRIIAVNKSNPKRIFANYLEFERDYSKPLDNGLTGSWKLVNNWLGSNNSGDVNADYYGIYNPITLSNGRTYAIANGWELTSTGINNFGNLGLGDYSLLSNGDALVTENTNGNMVISKRTLTGFDSNNVPVYGSKATVCTVPTSLIPDSYPTKAGSTMQNTPNPSRYIFWNALANNGGFALSSVKAGATKPEWQSTPSTHASNGGLFYDYFTGDYPTDGTLSAGSYINTNLSNALVDGDDVVWSHSRDFYFGSSYATIINHYNAATGLFLGGFSKTWRDVTDVNGVAPGYAGNAYIQMLARANGDLYNYYGEENSGGIIHSLHITGLNTISIDSIPLTITAAITKTADATDLMAGVPYHSATGFYGGYGWTVTPSAEVSGSWYVATSTKSAPKASVDIYWQGSGSGHSVARDLGSNNTNNWTLTGEILARTGGSQLFFNVLDASGKVLTELWFTGASIKINNIVCASDPNNDYTTFQNKVFQRYEPFVLKNTGGVVTFQYKNYSVITLSSSFEAGGNFNTPATFRARTTANGDNEGDGGIRKLRFVK